MTRLEDGGEGRPPATAMIITWGDVLPGDEVLDEGRLITVDDIRVYPQDGHPDFLIASASGYTEDGRGVHVSPPAASLTAVRRPGGTAAAQARSTVTVATGTGPDRQWAASAIEITDEGALLIGDGEKDGVEVILAIYAPGQWMSAGLDGHRAAGK